MTAGIYAVRVGRKGPALYYTWAECESVVKGFPSAIYKKFMPNQVQEAKAFAFADENKHMSGKEAEISVYTDGSFTSASESGYGAVFVKDNHIIGVVYGPCSKVSSIRNIGGEIQAAERAISFAIKFGFRSINIFHDYEGVGRWGNGEWNASKPDTENYKNFVQASKDKIEITFTKVKGHSGNFFNDKADYYASLGSRQSAECTVGFDGGVKAYQSQEMHASAHTDAPQCICPVCGNHCRSDSAFCNECGTVFDENTIAIPAASLKSRDSIVMCANPDCDNIISVSRATQVKVYRDGNYKQLRCCCSRCADSVRNIDMARITTIFEEIACQFISETKISG